MSITVVGSVALDSIATEAGSVSRAIGGSAVHFANAASLNSSVNVVGVVGEDFPFEHIEYLKKRGVDLSGIEVVEGGKTFFWKGRYEGDMNKAISEITELNVFENFKPVLPGNFKNSDILFLANIHPVLQMDVLKQVSDKSIIIMDSMNFWIESAKDDLLKVIEQVNAVILNDEEVRSLTGRKNLLVAGRAILEKGPKYVIIKKGEHGVLAITKDWVVSFPAILLDSIIDPTGAGDSFAGALVGYLDQAGSFDKETWKKALVYATCVASYNVQAFSIKGIAAITKDDVYKQFENYKKASMVMEI